jgi:hypothetical protein
VSRLNPTVLDAILRRYYCAYCEAQPGEWCVVWSSGKWAPYPHTARYDMAIRAGALPLTERIVQP